MIFEVNILAGFTLIHIMLGYGGYEHHQRENMEISSTKKWRYSMKKPNATNIFHFDSRSSYQ